MLYIIDIPCNILPFFFFSEFLPILGFVTSWISEFHTKLQVVCQSFWTYRHLISLLVLGLRQGKHHTFYYICHPSEPSQGFHSAHIQEYSQIPGLVTRLSPSVLLMCGCVSMSAWPVARQNSEDLDETAASIYVTEYFPCNRTNKRQARTLIKYLWSRPGTPNDYKYFSSERRNLFLAGAGTPN